MNQNTFIVPLSWLNLSSAETFSTAPKTGREYKTENTLINKLNFRSRVKKKHAVISFNSFHFYKNSCKTYAKLWFLREELSLYFHIPVNLFSHLPSYDFKHSSQFFNSLTYLFFSQPLWLIFWGADLKSEETPE